MTKTVCLHETFIVVNVLKSKQLQEKVNLKNKGPTFVDSNLTVKNVNKMFYRRRIEDISRNN